MTDYKFDTHKFVKQLESAGASPQMAEAFVSAQKEILSDALDSTLATKLDIARLEASGKADLLAAKNELKLELSGMRGEMAVQRWMTGMLIALAVANFAKQFF